MLRFLFFSALSSTSKASTAALNRCSRNFSNGKVLPWLCQVFVFHYVGVVFFAFQFVTGICLISFLCNARNCKCWAYAVWSRPPKCNWKPGRKGSTDPWPNVLICSVLLSHLQHSCSCHPLTQSPTRSVTHSFIYSLHSCNFHSFSKRKEKKNRK